MAQVTPVNVQIPASAAGPVVADFVEHALRVAYVNRHDAERMPIAEWSVPGVYVLLADDGSRQAYVGQAVDLRKRLLQHRSVPKLNWSRAICIKRDTTHGFNSADIGYLEGRVAAEVNALDAVIVVEGKRDQDSTLPPHMQLSLDALVPSVMAALRLAGVDTTRDDPVSKAHEDAEPVPDDETPEAVRPGTEQGGAPRRRGRIAYPATRMLKEGTVADLLAAGLLQAGTRLYAQQGGKSGVAVVNTAGELVVDQLSFGSPSGAAAHALDLRSVNGWITWHLGNLSGPTLASLREQLGRGPRP